MGDRWIGVSENINFGFYVIFYESITSSPPSPLIPFCKGRPAGKRLGEKSKIQKNTFFTIVTVYQDLLFLHILIL